ncbi:MAG: hypothetical protein BJ554DRAFT_7257, partial [Olpidium bornovanus]
IVKVRRSVKKVLRTHILSGEVAGVRETAGVVRVAYSPARQQRYAAVEYWWFSMASLIHLRKPSTACAASAIHVAGASAVHPLGCERPAGSPRAVALNPGAVSIPHWRIPVAHFADLWSGRVFASCIDGNRRRRRPMVANPSAGTGAPPPAVPPARDGPVAVGLGPLAPRPDWALDPVDFLREMGDVPLFMKTLPPDAEENVPLQALQALAYDGTPEGALCACSPAERGKAPENQAPGNVSLSRFLTLTLAAAFYYYYYSSYYAAPSKEIADNFRNQGNDCYREGQRGYHDAVKFYTDALAQKCDNAELNAKCYLNRAAVNLALSGRKNRRRRRGGVGGARAGNRSVNDKGAIAENFRKVLNDCASALKINPKLIVAYYRSAKALYELDKIDEALDCLDRGLKIEPANETLKAELKKCEDRKAVLLAKWKQESERRNRERREQEEVAEALRLRGIRVVSTGPGARSAEASYRLALDPETGNLVWPCFFLYPEHKESDFIQAFDEVSTFGDHIDVMFEQPAPWDARREYRPDSVDVFFESEDPARGRAGLVRVGREVNLLTALKHPKYVVKDYIPSFIILPKTGAFREGFIKRYKTN